MIRKGSLYSTDWETVLEAMRLRTSHTAKLFHNQEPQRRLKKRRSRGVEPTEGTEGSCNHSMAVKILATRLGQRRTPSVTTPHNKAIIPPNLSLWRRACRLSESSSMPRWWLWREMPSLEKQSIDLSTLCWQAEEPRGPRVWESSRQCIKKVKSYFRFGIHSTTSAIQRRYMELTWQRKPGPYRHKRHHAISYLITGDPLCGLAQCGMHFAHQISPQRNLMPSCTVENNPRQQSRRWHCGQQDLTSPGWGAISQVGGVWGWRRNGSHGGQTGEAERRYPPPYPSEFPIASKVDDLRV